jgi:plastocyanin
MRKIAIVFVLLGLLSFGCADDPNVPEGPTDEASETTGEPEGSHVPTTTTFTDTEFELEIELDDFYFEPTTIKAPGDSTASIELVNEGDQAHTFTIDDLDVDETLEAGESKDVTVELGTETIYEFYCRFHVETQGMKGSFSPH